jgi:UDPglucose--hexose-1-phosphate uridylyltransferase
MHRLEMSKPDGRALMLYSRRPMSAAMSAPSPFAEPLGGQPQLRWHPLRGEWVTYAAYRQGRTFLPPPEYNPLAPTLDGAFPTEVPAGDWEIAVFDNRFPALALPQGKCEVVVFTQDPKSSLGALPLAHIELLIEVWAERSERLGALSGIEYVLPFENRGAEVGVTLHHPHGQIYAYPVVPPVPARMRETALEGRGLLRRVIEKELEDDTRLLYRGQHALAFVPYCARYPYEAWVAPLEPVAAFGALSAPQRRDLARALKTLLLKYDGLWRRPFPYLMAWYQAPTDGKAHPEAHLHAQFYPPYRTPDRLKYLAGTELAAGFFAMDALPEDKARELQAVEVRLE